MPELGRYATEVLWAYGLSLGLIIALVVLSWRQAVASKKALETLEDE